MHFVYLLIGILSCFGNYGVKAQKSCYACNRCLTGCDAKNCTDNISCPSGSKGCYIGYLNGFWYQGCITPARPSLSSTYFDYHTCDNTLCNNYNGLKCYVSSNAAEYSYTDVEWCTGSYTKCFKYRTFFTYHQGCTDLSYDYYRMYISYWSHLCTESLCNDSSKLQTINIYSICLLVVLFSRFVLQI